MKKYISYDYDRDTIGKDGKYYLVSDVDKLINKLKYEIRKLKKENKKLENLLY